MNKLKDWVSRLKKGHMLSVIGVFIIIIAVLITVLVRKEQDSKQASENSYNMAFYSLVDYVENVETYLAKSLISSTPEHGAETLTNVWKELLGSNYQEIYNKYINTIGNLTLTGYNSSLSNKSFIEKRDMEKGFKESRLRLNNYLGSIDKWGEDEIVKRAEMLYDLSLEVWKYPEVQYVQEYFKGNLFSLADDDDFTNSKVKQFSFLSDMIKITNWTRLYELVCLSIYDLEPVKFKRLAYKK